MLFRLGVILSCVVLVWCYFDVRLEIRFAERVQLLRTMLRRGNTVIGREVE